MSNLRPTPLGIKLCKYADVHGNSYECYYKNIAQERRNSLNMETRLNIHSKCPKDSGTDGKCNGICYELKVGDV